MDGGSGVRTATKERTIYNLDGVLDEIKAKDPDFIYFQEVDLSSTRSSYINESKYLQDNTNGYASTFAYNFNVDYVPFQSHLWEKLNPA